MTVAQSETTSRHMAERLRRSCVRSSSTRQQRSGDDQETALIVDLHVSRYRLDAISRGWLISRRIRVMSKALPKLDEAVEAA